VINLNKDGGKLLTVFIAVLFGVYGLIRLVANADLIVGFLSLTFGITAMIWTYRAMGNLSPGTSLREYTSYFFYSLTLVVLFSVWDTLASIFNWEGFLLYPKYLLITAAYLVLSFAGYKILYLGKQFGFKQQVKDMKLKKTKKSVKSRK